MVSMSPSHSLDSMLVACADGRLLSLVIPSDLLLSDKDGWAGELELADVHAAHAAPVLCVHALHGEAAAVSIDATGCILMWSLLSGACLTSVSMFAPPLDPTEAAVAFAASSCGRLVAAGSSSGGVAMFDLSTVSTRKCVLWSRLDATAVLALASHPSLPVFCVAFASNRIVFLSVAAAAVSVIGHTTADAPIISLHWLDSASPGHVLLLLRDATLLRLSCPALQPLPTAHTLAPLDSLSPLRVRVTDVVAGLTGDVSGMVCRLITACVLPVPASCPNPLFPSLNKTPFPSGANALVVQVQRGSCRCRRRHLLRRTVDNNKAPSGSSPTLEIGLICPNCSKRFSPFRPRAASKRGHFPFCRLASAAAASRAWPYPTTCRASPSAAPTAASRLPA